MSEYEPITAELRELMGGVEPRVDEDGVVTAKYVTPEAWAEFVRRCDAIDAVHAGLERENAELRQRVAVLDNERGNMHDGGSITDELRAWWVRKFPVMDKELHKNFTAIADRIDAEHEAQLNDAFETRNSDENLESDGWVRLPKSIEDKPINEHDKVDWRDHAGMWHENVTVVAVCNDGCYVMDGIVFHVHKSDIRHHHAPTVEDVLREMADRCYADEDEPRDRDAIVAEYAAKLCLAGDAS